MTGTTRERLPSFFSTSTARPRLTPCGSSRWGLPSISWKAWVITGDPRLFPLPASLFPQHVLTVRRDHRQLGQLPVVEQLPPLLVDGGGIAQILLVHHLHEGGVVRAEHELAHDRNVIKRIFSAMKCLRLVALLLPGIAAAGASQQATGLRAALDARIARAPARAVGLYYRSLARADSILIGANLRFHAASTMKLPVMIQIFRDADTGLLGLDDSLTLHTAFPSRVEGAFVVGKEDDSDSTLYALVGRNRAVRDLLERMITRSSNLATNILIERVGATRAQASARALGAWSMQVLRGVEDGAAYRAGLNNTTTARDLGVLLEAIATRRAASGAACDSMLAILGRQEFNEGIPVGVPPGTRVAHKTGWIGEVVYHDAAVVSPAAGGGYVLVVLTGGIKEDSVAHNLVADLSRLVYDGVRR